MATKPLGSMKKDELIELATKLRLELKEAKKAKAVPAAPSEDLERLQEQLGEAQAEVTRLGQEVQRKESTIQKLQVEKRELADKLVQSEEALRKSREANKDLNIRAQTAERGLEEERQKHQKTLDEANRRLTESAKALKSMEHDREEALKLAEEAEEETRKLQGQLREKADELEAVENRRPSRSQVLAVLRRDPDDFRMDVLDIYPPRQVAPLTIEAVLIFLRDNPEMVPAVKRELGIENPRAPEKEKSTGEKILDFLKKY